jgi:hypothetical protein
MVRYHEIKENAESKELIQKIHNAMSSFKFTGEYELTEDLEIDVNGSCQLVEGMTKIPYKFNIVSGIFKCSNNVLATLKNCPNSVGSFECKGLNITSLEGGPKTCYGDYNCSLNGNLNSLDGIAEYIGGKFDVSGTNLELYWDTEFDSDIQGTIVIPYHKNLPLLRIITVEYTKSKIKVAPDMSDYCRNCFAIVLKYINQPNQKKAIYDCQYELIKAGFKGNAKW